MNTLPWLPSGQGDLPAERLILYATPDRRVFRLDESVVLGEDGLWISPSLNQEDQSRVYTLTRLLLVYSAAASTSLQVSASGDGTNWTEEHTVVLPQADGIGRVAQGFNTSGFDLRFRIVLDTDVLVNIFGYGPTLVRRSSYVP